MRQNVVSVKGKRPGIDKGGELIKGKPTDDPVSLERHDGRREEVEESEERNEE